MRVKLTNSDKQTTNKKWTQTKQKRKKNIYIDNA